jgi:hypothetical protein
MIHSDTHLSCILEFNNCHYMWCIDTQLNDTYHNDTQHNENQHGGLFYNTLKSIFTIIQSGVMLNVVMQNDEGHYWVQLWLVSLCWVSLCSLLLYGLSYSLLCLLLLCWVLQFGAFMLSFVLLSITIPIVIILRAGNTNCGGVAQYTWPPYWDRLFTKKGQKYFQFEKEPA